MVTVQRAAVLQTQTVLILMLQVAKLQWLPTALTAACLLPQLPFVLHLRSRSFVAQDFAAMSPIHAEWWVDSRVVFLPLLRQLLFVQHRLSQTSADRDFAAMSPIHAEWWVASLAACLHPALRPEVAAILLRIPASKRCPSLS